MYEASWYDAFVPRSSTQQDKSKGHKRRESLLKQPNDGTSADVETAVGIPEIPEELTDTIGPPEATIARRAKSYSDFYDVVRAHVRKEHEKEREAEKAKKRTRDQIKTEIDFTEWYGDISDELLDASHEQYRLYHDQLSLTKSHLDNLLLDTSSALKNLVSLSNSFKAVEHQTTAFQTQCESLVHDQRRIVKLADEVEDNLRYYAYLEPITRRLNAPGAGNHVRRKEYVDMLENLDSCLEYMESHPSHREAATYRSRYRLLLTRGLTLIRVHITNALREIAADVSKRIADRQLNETTMSALLYAKFRVGAPELKQLGLQIQKRAVVPANAEAGTEAEYQSLMNELYQSYSTARGRLILPIVSKEMGEIALAPSTSKDLVAFARSSISFLRGILVDEYELWFEWFETDGRLYHFLESLCEPLFDHLRPRIIHETQMTKLCELCTFIQTRYIDPDEEEEDPLDRSRLNFPALIHSALEDAQTRLVFLALGVLKTDIEQYRPKPEDLDYPGRFDRNAKLKTLSAQPALSGRKGSQNGVLPQTMIVESEEDGLSAFNFNAYQDWYPTMRKAIWLLSKIYRLVHSSVFDDLAHQIVHQTTLSLHNAASQISQRSSPTDANLFLIKHLLLLKQQIVAFDIEFVTPEVGFDFSSMTSTFHELRSRGGLFNPANLMRLVGGGLVPKVVENMLDAKAELDGKLRTVINEFTNSFATRMAAAVSEGAQAKKSFDPHAATQLVRSAMEKETPFMRKRLEEYIDDVRTRETLVAAVQDRVIELYETFHDRYVAQSRANGKGLPKKGKGRDDEVWDAEAFAEWAEGLFNVGRLAFEQDMDEDDDVGSMGSGISRSGST
ncbi:Sec34-domain-containing protein [Pseudovirgaria hyperparasitica]|uniref:Conserved oligomeric Golgi complex subunit 3 n=1 Tax=Pseudovirgaria hyperparasitica TaxID=470096 RepID=A0A6A6WFW8_9PEZI|nr:Sec34-domain-containing protein [Pseudovirgaria hyperparasitica]KAF2760816.1 Sec34-domain-containing protein [Pseudovirgaria hyperparasitica]